MAGVLGDLGLSWADCRIVHWSVAEPVNLDGAYNAARARHPQNDWPSLPWFDFLQAVVRTEPIAIRDAFDFGLKSIAKAMHEAGLIGTTWKDGPTDGLGAMIGAWWCDAEAARLVLPIGDMRLVVEIATYIEVDCRAVAGSRLASCEPLMLARSSTRMVVIALPRRGQSHVRRRLGGPRSRASR